MENLKIVTLNCWGIPIPGISKMRQQRMQCIGQELAKGDYHIVVLEEIWSKDDFRLLKDAVSNKLPYSHYFYSGPIGSGVCVFTKLPILETFFHRFHLNGDSYKVQHGDWFGGKGVGLCKLEFQGFRINLYATHIHAEYNRDYDEYLPHRVSQAFEMSQFIRLTASQCDVVIAAGDFNLESTDTGFKILLTNTPLFDAWEHKLNFEDAGASGATCECPTNMFADKSLADLYPFGKRIDYVCYAGQPGTDVEVKRCYVTLGQVPGEDFPFSDHEGVAAELSLSRSKQQTTDLNQSASSSGSRSSLQPQRSQDCHEYLAAALDIVGDGIRTTERAMGRFLMQAVGIAVLLYGLCHSDMAVSNPAPITFVIGLVKLALVVVVAALIWLGVVVKRGEVQGLIATQLDLTTILGPEPTKRSPQSSKED